MTSENYPHIKDKNSHILCKENPACFSNCVGVTYSSMSTLLLKSIILLVFTISHGDHKKDTCL